MCVRARASICVSACIILVCTNAISKEAIWKILFDSRVVSCYSIARGGSTLQRGLDHSQTIVSRSPRRARAIQIL